MKKFYISILLIIIVIFILISGNFIIEKNKTVKEVSYTGSNLLISIDGVSSNTLPTSGFYYLANYECKSKNTILSWDNSNYKLNVTNGGKEAGAVCNLEFKSNPRLSDMPVGSYVKYSGEGGAVGETNVNCKINGTESSSIATEETEAPNSCLGQNAREDIDNNKNTYGYCHDSNYKYYTSGWRLAYIDDNNKPVIISAGSPECNNRESVTGNITYIKKANTKAMKYCNSDYVDGDCSCVDSDSDGLCDCTDSNSNGLCDEIENGTVDAWAVSDLDFYKMTKAISGVGKRLASKSSNLGDVGGTLGTTLTCMEAYSREECGYNNDLIDNGGDYWFAAINNFSSASGVIWSPQKKSVYLFSNSYAGGLRPVISLSSSVYVIGGAGTMKEPYIISNSSFSINNGSVYINSSDDKSNVVLNLVGSVEVAQMCINIGSSVCSNYVSFDDTYILDLSDELDGEKIIYIYYKDLNGKIIAAMNKRITIDTVAPSNNSISISSGSDLSRTLTLSSVGADYMCFSNTSNDASQCNDWVSYSSSYSWNLTEGSGTKTVYAFFKDKAGNISTISGSVEVITDFRVYEDFNDEVIDSNIIINSVVSKGWNISNGRLQSSNMGHDDTDSISEIKFQPTADVTLSFDYGVSSEEGADTLCIYLSSPEGTYFDLVVEESGEVSGEVKNISLKAGEVYSLVVWYAKDLSAYAGDDVAWIDNLVIE